MNEIEKKKLLLSKPTWTYKDIMEYFHVGKSCAFTIKNRAIKAGYGTQYGTTYVKPNGVLIDFNTTLDEEIEKITRLTNELHEDNI